MLKTAQSGDLHDEIKSRNKEFYRRLQTEIIADYGRNNLVYVSAMLQQSQGEAGQFNSTFIC